MSAVNEPANPAEATSQAQTGSATESQQTAPETPDDAAAGGKRMPFLEHLEELRWTLIRSLFAVVVCAVACYFFVSQIVSLLVVPAPDEMKLIFLSPTEAFMTYLKVAGYAGVVVAFPYISWEFWRFIVPGLLAKERKLVFPIVVFTVICFVTGALFAYFIIIPFGLDFLLSFQSDFLVANITIGKYLTFVVTLLLLFGLVFELPVLAYFLSLIGLLTPQFLRSKRRYGILTIFIVAAVLTPPDAFTQTMMAIPLIFLYEISIWVSASVQRRRKREEIERDRQWAG